MVRALLAAFVLCAAPLTLGCKSGPQLTKVEAPAAGVALRYDLTPGQSYKGSVRHTETIRSATSSTSASNFFAFDLSLTVRGPDKDHGGMGVTARFSAVTVRWSLPLGISISVAEYNRKASEALQGLEIDFAVDDTGKIVYMPELPEEFPGELRGPVQQALDQLETAFLPVPSNAIKVGDQWKEDKKRGKKGKLGRYVEGAIQTRVDGFYRTGEPPVTVAKLVSEESVTEVTTTTSGGHEVKKRATTEALFATEQNYLISYVSDRQTDDLGNSTSFEKTEVSWTKMPAPAGAQTQVQDISDPCHPDYVGAEECKSDTAQPADGQPPASSQPPASEPPPPAN